MTSQHPIALLIAEAVEQGVPAPQQIVGIPGGHKKAAWRTRNGMFWISSVSQKGYEGEPLFEIRFDGRKGRTDKDACHSSWALRALKLCLGMAKPEPSEIRRYKAVRDYRDVAEREKLALKTWDPSRL